MFLGGPNSDKLWIYYFFALVHILLCQKWNQSLSFLVKIQAPKQHVLEKYVPTELI
jgi:hypothetical protein